MLKKELFRSNKCPLCRGLNIAYEFEKDNYKYYQCKDCNFIYLNPQPNDEELNKIYNKNYFIGSGNNEFEQIVLDMKKQTAALYIKQLISYYGSPSGKLIEIGCGNGDFLLLAKLAGFEIAGLELSAHSTGVANEKLGTNSVICGTLDTINLPEKEYDICCLFDSIEHFRDPVASLKKIRKILKPNGVLFIVTPSLDSKSAKFLKHNWMEFKPEHLSYFDSQTIQNSLAKTGFSNIYISPNNKYLNFEYIKGHFDIFKVPFFTKLIFILSIFLPASIKHRNIRVVASGINVLARNTGHNLKRISIIIPVYNEVKTFNELIERVLEKELNGLEKEIIIVESNSKDGSREAVLKYKGYSNIKIILEDYPKGKGHAVRNGLNNATGHIVLIQDADLEYDVNDYDQLLEPLLRYQKAFVLGSRHSNGFKMRHFATQPLVAFIMNVGQMFFTNLLNLFCNAELRDPFTMYKVFRKDCIYNLDLKANRFDFDWEIVIKLLRKGYEPLEIPINYSSRSFHEGKKVSLIKDPMSWIVAIFRFRFEKLYRIRY